jgi:hypothetical protein
MASMKGTGWDIAINSINTKGPVTWSTDFNFNTNKDRVTDYYRSSNQGSNFVGSGTAISAIPGRPVYAIYSYKWAGLDPLTGDPQGIVNGQVSKDYTALTGTGTLITGLVYHGSALPTVFGSLGNTIAWKNLSLTARLTYKMGYWFRRNTINYGSLFTSATGDPDYALRWQKPGDEAFTSVPSMIYPNNTRRDAFYTNSEILVEKGDHIRLQYISLSYTIKRKAKKRLPFSDMQLYANISNLGIIWRANKHGIDPDYQNNTILPAKNYAMGIRMSL